jgi:hypothetical protein
LTLTGTDGRLFGADPADLNKTRFFVPEHPAKTICG